MAKETDRMRRNDGVRKRGCRVKMPHARALSVACDMLT